MLFSTTKSTTSRRALARVAVAGAIVAVPLTALAIPASADASVAVPGVTEVRHHPHHNRDCDFGPFENWRCNNGPFGHDQDLFWQFRHNRPHGLFGSS
ncbi:hypothetical protein DFR70_105367 [Nocardia tenerifensis]|uniref:Uncharacterized protein n=1 Tax=Nocardia tenerifensis TaxID=228006 RepID=A0A318JZS0_9NOCA|nr:hypothetical protein [Nocardia tenerifensis]PXX64182.1 hypothetical protein DFR70_105367 [Nocardia tenerifensis]